MSEQTVKVELNLKELQDLYMATVYGTTEISRELKRCKLPLSIKWRENKRDRWWTLSSRLNKAEIKLREMIDKT